jgi:hypothetical protein
MWKQKEGQMKASVKSITMTSAILWGACMLIVGLIDLADASYGAEFLRPNFSE